MPIFKHYKEIILNSVNNGINNKKIKETLIKSFGLTGASIPTDNVKKYSTTYRPKEK